MDETAHVHLTRLCGCNYRVPITRKGKSVFLTDPQHSETRYRISAALFDEGKAQFRDTLCIERWSDKAERITASEMNWQD